MRPHTGRQRNEDARLAILRAAAGLLDGPSGTRVTIDAIAAAAGVGKQTIYRWWPSKAAVLLEAATERAGRVAPVPETGTLRGDLTAFLTETFAAVTEASGLLRALVGQAQHDSEAETVLRGFTAARRDALRSILERGRAELGDGADPELLVDQIYGFLWYRLLLGHAPLDADAARRLAGSVC